MFFDINCSQRVNQYLNIKLNVPKEKMIILDQACFDPTNVNQRKAVCIKQLCIFAI
jgi:hypothetical protein